LLDTILTGGVTPVSFAACTAVSLVAGILVAWGHSGKAHPSQGMTVTLALLPVMVQVVIMLVNGNLGAGVAVAGTFSLVRFRSVPGTARDIASVFLAMTAGLASGMGYLGLGLITSVLVCTTQRIYLFVMARRAPRAQKHLKVTIPEDLDYNGLLDDLFRKYTTYAELLQVKTTDMGSLYTLQYAICLKDERREKAFLDEVRCRNGNLDIVCGRVPVSGETL